MGRPYFELQPGPLGNSRDTETPLRIGSSGKPRHARRHRQSLRRLLESPASPIARGDSPQAHVCVRERPPRRIEDDSGHADRHTRRQQKRDARPVPGPGRDRRRAARMRDDHVRPARRLREPKPTGLVRVGLADDLPAGREPNRRAGRRFAVGQKHRAGHLRRPCPDAGYPHTRNDQQGLKLATHEAPPYSESLTFRTFEFGPYVHDGENALRAAGSAGGIDRTRISRLSRIPLDRAFTHPRLGEQLT